MPSPILSLRTREQFDHDFLPQEIAKPLGEVSLFVLELPRVFVEGRLAHSLLDYALFCCKSHNVARAHKGESEPSFFKGLTMDLQMLLLHWIMCEEEHSCLGVGTAWSNWACNSCVNKPHPLSLGYVVHTRHPDYLSSGCHLTISKDCALSKVISIGFYLRNGRAPAFCSPLGY